MPKPNRNPEKGKILKKWLNQPNPNTARTDVAKISRMSMHVDAGVGNNADARINQNNIFSSQYTSFK